MTSSYMILERAFRRPSIADGHRTYRVSMSVARSAWTFPGRRLKTPSGLGTCGFPKLLI